MAPIAETCFHQRIRQRCTSPTTIPPFDPPVPRCLTIPPTIRFIAFLPKMSTRHPSSPKRSMTRDRMGRTVERRVKSHMVLHVTMKSGRCASATMTKSSDEQTPNKQSGTNLFVTLAVLDSKVQTCTVAFSCRDKTCLAIFCFWPVSTRGKPSRSHLSALCACLTIGMQTLLWSIRRASTCTEP